MALTFRCLERTLAGRFWARGALVYLLIGALACRGPALSPVPTAPPAAIPVAPTTASPRLADAPVATVTPTFSPAPVATATSTHTLTPSPTPTPFPAPTATPAPTAALTPPDLREAGAGLLLPPGFRAQVLLGGLPNPTAFALDGRHALYVALQDGRILRGRDANGDGLPESAEVFASGFRFPLGLAFRGDVLYVSSRGKVTVLQDADGDGRADSVQDIITGLPAGAHQNNGPAFGPDGKLYLPVGSTCNACVEADPRSATVLRFNPDGSGGEVYARGLRNTYQLAFHPADGTLWGADNGRDDRGFEVPEELNLIGQDRYYGWPDCWGAGRGTRCAGTAPPVAELEPRSSADGIVFYTGSQFPPEYRLNLFLTMYGAHSRATGMKLVRAVLARDAAGGYRAAVSDFGLGFDRPLPVIVAPDGSLLVGDYGRGVIYRVSYSGE